MAKKKRKEVGKVVVKKRRRVSVSFRFPRRIRWDIVLVVVIVALVGVTLFYAYFTPVHHSSKVPQDIQTLRKYLKELAQGNESVTLILTYEVRGDIPINKEVLGVKDYLTLRLRYTEIEVPIFKLTGNKTQSTNKTIKFKGFAVFRYGLNYLPQLPKLLGISEAPKNLSEVLVSKESLIYDNVSFKSKVIGEDVISLRDLGKVRTIKEVLECSRRFDNSTLNYLIVVWRDHDYGLPLKVSLVIRDYKLNLTLVGFRIR